MPGNFLNFDYFSSFNAIFITFIFLFVAPSLILLGTFSALNDEDYEEIKNKTNKTRCITFLSFYTIIALILVLLSPIYLYLETTDNNFNSVYDVKFIEKSPISEIQYSKRDNFKGGNIINSLYKEKGTLYIIKNPKNDQYIVSTNKKILEDVLAGKDHSSNPDYQIVSKEDVKKALENKALENKVSEDKPQETAPSNVKENDFK